MDRNVDRVEKIISILAGFVTIATASYSVLIAAPRGVVVSDNFAPAPLQIESLPLKLIVVVIACLSVAASASTLLVYLGKRLNLIYVICIVVLSMIFAWIALTCIQWIALGAYRFNSDWMFHYFLLGVFSAFVTAVFVFIRSEPYKVVQVETQPVWIAYIQVGTRQVTTAKYNMAIHPALIALIQAAAYAALFHASVIGSY